MPAMPTMMAQAPYEIRTGGDGKSKKQSMAELKLRRLTELNQRLREDLERRRIPVSEAALEYV
jgi:guanine nucleotide-binding protein subunit gamma